MRDRERERERQREREKERDRERQREKEDERLGGRSQEREVLNTPCPKSLALRGLANNCT